MHTPQSTMVTPLFGTSSSVGMALGVKCTHQHMTHNTICGFSSHGWATHWLYELSGCGGCVVMHTTQSTMVTPLFGVITSLGTALGIMCTH